MNDWEKYKERKSKNIGFLSRLKAFRDPTPDEMAAAIAAETKSWQETKGKKNYKTGLPYYNPIYKAGEYGVNLKADRLDGEPIKGPEREAAMKAYVETPMDPHGILKKVGIDISAYESKKGFLTRIKNWFKYKFMEPKPTVKYWHTFDEEFIKKWSPRGDKK